MTRVAVATTSANAADAAPRVADAGGNAVDCALGTAITAMNMEPGVCAFAGGAYVTVWAPGADPVTFDGNHTVPGMGLTAAERGHGKVTVRLDYGGGITTIVGPGSVAVPGAIAAIDSAWRSFGSIDWRHLFSPAIDAARQGFPLSESCRYYLGYSGGPIFGRSEDGHSALHDENGRLIDKGDLVHVPHLADTLAAIADEGAELFYAGELGQRIASHVRDGEGALTREDMESFTAIERPALVTDIGAWQIATNPPPAVGGSVLTAMLLACRDLRGDDWNSETLDRLIHVQRACLDFRRDRLDIAEDVVGEAINLLHAARDGELLSRWISSSTIHVSAVDDTGLGCAVTASAGYGSGEMPEGTGLWLNNGLGEIELNRREVETREPGERVPSNMAPTVARRNGAVIAIGSPGADRITTAIHQVLTNFMQFGLPLPEAIVHPRVHVDTTGDEDKLRAEPGLDLPATELPLHLFDGPNMYFGGVSVASFDDDNGFEVVADARREGGTYLSDA